MQQMRFHCGEDTTEINGLLEKGLKSGKKTANELVALYARELIGRPYVAHTLEGAQEMLTINIDELDYLSCGMVWDMLTEQSNDSYDYPKLAGQNEYNEFLSG